MADLSEKGYPIEIVREQDSGVETYRERLYVHLCDCIAWPFAHLAGRWTTRSFALVDMSMKLPALEAAPLYETVV